MLSSGNMYSYWLIVIYIYCGLTSFAYCGISIVLVLGKAKRNTKEICGHIDHDDACNAL